MSKLVGCAASLQIGFVSSLPFTRIEVSCERKLQILTDSTDFSQAQNFFYPRQKCYSTQYMLRVEGWYDTLLTPLGVTNPLFSDAPVGLAIYLRGGLLFGQGFFYVSNVAIGIPANDTVAYSFDAKSNGPFGPVIIYS
jgi:hypothetical protein